MFRSILIANRGEIALRVARTCREMGITTVAVCSAADERSLAARFADKVVRIGPPSPKRSYLSAPAIIEAALQSGAEAIHPGYGFLSEDPDFAEICEANELTFIGPPAGAMARLGDKAVARQIMREAGLPLVPGSESKLASESQAKQVADAIGYPVIIKAAAGGGGRGMSVVSEPRAFDRTYRETRATAQAVFGDDQVYVERYLEQSRHIEVQILCDQHGHSIHLGERDCSVQRRHQKLVEESPAPGLAAGLAKRICEAAVAGALASGLTGAATFEFLVDGDDFYFIEVNCRIQVEHPVTEMITGLDIVREQILAAAGQPLQLTQNRVTRRGAALECRVNSEDPERGFTPTPGTLAIFQPPGGPFTRVDTAAFPGCTITPDYDSLLAKVVTWGPDRPTAIRRMDRALSEFQIEGHGMRTTIPLLRRVLADRRFTGGTHTTSLLRQISTPGA